MNHTQNEFIKAFKLKLDSTENKDFLIQNEITQIEAFTSSEATILKSSKMFTVYDNKTNSVFDLSNLGKRTRFNKIFYEYLINGETNLDQAEEPVYKRAVEFSEYYKWLNSLKHDTRTTKKPKLTLKQKILALHFLGLDLKRYDNVKTAKILSQILDVGEENTRKYLSYVSAGKNNGVRTKQNLEKVIQLFENSGITEISNKIPLDLEK